MASCSLRGGVIISIQTDRLRVRLEPDESMGEGEGCRSCGMRGMCHSRNSEVVDVTIPDPDAAKRRPGERVRIRYVQVHPAAAAAIMFLPALAGLILGGFVANRLFGEGNGIFLAGSGCGLASGIFATFAINRLSPSLGPKCTLADAVID